MIDFIHNNAKNSWQWIGLDFSLRLIPFTLIIFLVIQFKPSILDNMYLSKMDLSGWTLLSVLTIFTLLWSFFSHYKKQENFKLKLKHHHYKYLASKKHNNSYVTIYKIFVSFPITFFFCFIFLPAIFQHFLPFPNIFILIASSIIYPIEYMFIEGHSARSFFFLLFVSIWLLFATYWLKSFLFIMLFGPVLSFSQTYTNKPLHRSNPEKQKN